MRFGRQARAGWVGTTEGEGVLTEAFVAEDVTLVSAAVAADDLGPGHAPRTVGDLGDGARDRVEEGGPCRFG